MVRVLLVCPTWPEVALRFTAYVPEVTALHPFLGVAYVAAALEGRHQVSIHDRNLARVRLGGREAADELLQDIMRREGPDVVGITVTTPLVADAYHVARLARRLNPAVTVVAGGPHCTAVPESVLAESPDIDVVVRGEGELPAARLLEGAGWDEVPGLAFRRGGRVVRTPRRRARGGLDALPRPARHLLPRECYETPSNQVVFGVRGVSAPMVSSRGCTGRCAFCAGPVVCPGPVRSHSPARVADEVEEAVTAYGVDTIMFNDDMFTHDPRRVEAICEELTRRKLHTRFVWGVQARVDAIDRGLLRTLRRAGCVQVEFGYESGSQRVLDGMRKNATVEAALRSGRLAKEEGMRQLANIIVGWPTETLEDLRATIRLMEAVAPEFLSFHELMPLPGTWVWKYLRDRGRLAGFVDNEPFRYCEVDPAEREEMRRLYRGFEESYAGPSNRAGGELTLPGGPGRLPGR